MKKFFIALLALFPFMANQADAKMTHKWDEEHYAKGEFHVKKHDYPKARKEAGQDMKNRRPDEPVKVDHKGRVYRESEYPPPRNSAKPQ